MKGLLLSLVGFGFASSLLAQPLAFRKYGEKDGFTQSQVTSLLEDRDGFLWIGMVNSVARLGPCGVKTYGRIPGFVHPTQVKAMIQDRHGSIWAADTTRGVFEIRGNQIKNYGPKDGITRPQTHSVLEDEDGSIYVGCRFGLFRSTSQRTFEEMKLPDPWQSSPIRALALDPKHRGIWLGSSEGRLGLWDGQRVAQAHLPDALSHSMIMGFQKDPKGQLWALLSQGLIRLEGDVWVPVPLEDVRGNMRLVAFSIDAKGEILIAMGSDGIYQWFPDGRQRMFTRRDGLPREAINVVLRDRHGVMWVGSDGDYLSAQVVPELRTLQNDPLTGQSLAMGAVMNFLELSPGRILIASTGGGLYLWEDGRGITGHWMAKDGLPSDDCWSLSPASQGGAWVGTAKGLALWRNGVITKGPKELEERIITDFVKHAGRLWVSGAKGGSTNGIAELSLEGRCIRFHAVPRGFPKINVMIPWEEGLLLGTNIGLFLFHNGEYFKSTEFTECPIDNGAISAMVMDVQKRLWVASSNDLYCGFRKGDHYEWTVLSSKQLAITPNIYFLSLLPSGTIVIGHSQGVSFYQDGQAVCLTRNHGLITNETNQNSFLRDSKGRLWIGMIGGACILDSGWEPKAPLLPRPQVIEASWNGGSAWLPTSVDLPANPGNLALTVDVGVPIAPEVPRFQTRMAGIDSDWRPLEERQNSIQIAQLTYGSYRLYLRVSLDGTNWVESQPFPITVKRAWYQTYFMKTIFVLAGISFVVLVLRWRLRRLKARAHLLEVKVEERTAELALRNKAMERLHRQLKQSLESRVQLMNTVTHDIRSPLTSILISVENLRMDSVTHPSLDPKLCIMEREAKRLEALLRSMLDQSRSESLTDNLNQRLCHPSEVLQGIADTLQFKAESRNLQSELQMDAASDEVWVLADITALQQVLFNLVENALKFTPSPGSVGIRAKVQEDSWILDVWDTGRGIPPEKLKHIFGAFQQAEEGDNRSGWGLGLSICKTMVEAHQGSINVASQVGKGSTFRVSLPLVVAGNSSERRVKGE